MMSTETTTKTNHYFRALAVLAALALAASLLVQVARPAVAAPVEGNVRTWGNNYYGQLGNGINGPGTSKNTPVVVNSLGDVKTVAGGCQHSLALKTDGTVRAWGGNYWGQLGNGTINDSTAPVQVEDANDVTGYLTNIKAIAAGCDHNLALKTDGTVRAWGGNIYGQLGNGTFNDSNTPVQVSNLSGVKAIAAGDINSLAAKQ